MPRDLSGNYSLPAGNPVVTLTPIATAWANPTMSDVAQAITDSLDRQGRGGMLAPFKFADGTLGLPSGSFTLEPTLGFYRKGAGQFAIAVSGADAGIFSATGVTMPAGSLTVGATALAAASSLFIQSAAGQARFVRILTGNLTRWSFGGNSSAESGANAGTGFDLTASDDAGTAIDNPISIVRASGGAFNICGATSRPLIIGSATGPTGQSVQIRSVAGQVREIAFSSGALRRWRIVTDTATESGGNLGSNFFIGALDDTGTPIDTAFTITRAAGGTIELGTSGAPALRNVNIYGNLFAGFGTKATTSSIFINAAAGQLRELAFMSAGLRRWRVSADTAVESGANAGSAYLVTAFDDAGGTIDAPIAITRASAGTVNIGGTSVRSTLFTGNATVGSLKTTTSANFTVGNSTLAAVASVTVLAAAGQSRQLAFNTGAFLSRWVLEATAAAESGANAGSNFNLNRYTDAGGFLGTAIGINRATGVVNFETTPTVAGVPIVSAGSAEVVSAADQSTATTTLVASTQLTLPAVSGGVYFFEADLNFTQSAGGSGVKVGASNSTGVVTIFGPTTVDANARQDVKASSTGASIVATVPADFAVVVRGRLIASATANIAVTFANDTGVGTITLKNSSHFRLIRAV